MSDAAFTYLRARWPLIALACGIALAVRCL